MDFLKISCPICGSDEHSLVSNKGQFNIKLYASLCKQCGLMYLNPRWSKSSYDHFYANLYDHFYRTSKSKKNFPELYYGKIKQIHGRMLKEGLFPAKIENALDIGSGEGWPLLYLKENHEKSGKNTPLNLHAIEPSSRCLKTLKEFGINVISNDVDSDWHKKYKHKFDFIIMRHVLEHFMDPVSVLKKVSSSLTKDGLVYIAVPNSMNPQLPLNKTFFRAVHTFYFSRISLHNVINLSNLEIMHLSASPKDSPHEIYALCRKSRKAVPPVILNDEFFLQKEVLSNSYKKEKSFKFKIDNSINNLKNHTKRRIIKLIPSGIKKSSYLKKAIGIYHRTKIIN